MKKEETTKKSVKKTEEYKQGTRFIVILSVVGALLVTLVTYVVYLEMYGKNEYIKEATSDEVSQKVLQGKIITADGEQIVWNKWTRSDKQEERKTEDYDAVFLPLISSGVKVNMEDAYIGKNEVLVKDYTAKGETIELTIHADLQRKAHEIFEKRKPGKLGAIVALNPETGEILCAYTHRVTENGGLTQRNEAFNAAYSPGSTMKVLWAGTAIDNNKEIDDHKPYAKESYYGVQNLSGNQIRRGIPTTVNVKTAIQYSVNTYFAQLAVEELKEPLMREYAERMFVGKELHVDGSEKLNAKLGNANLQNWGIGHEMQVSPLHMAMLAAAIANDGEIMTPYLIARSTRYNGEISLENSPKVAGQLFKTSTARDLQKYMKAVVNENGGTAYGNAKGTSTITKIAGKTGTANSDDAWFIGFAPADNPQIAVAIFIEHGGAGGVDASPIGKELIEYYLTSEDEQ